jgi:hypothetical protein
MMRQKPPLLNLSLLEISLRRLKPAVVLPAITGSLKRFFVRTRACALFKYSLLEQISLSVFYYTHENRAEVALQCVRTTVFYQ